MSSEDKYVPQTANGVSKKVTQIIISSILCHNDTIYKEWLNPSIISKESMHKNYFDQNLKLQNLFNSFLTHASLVEIKALVQKKELTFTVFQRMVTLKIKRT